MRVATYNVWNSEKGMPQREQYVIDEIVKINADIVCLQEVRDRVQAETITKSADYSHCFFDHYPGEAEGLCILSKIPFSRCVSWITSCNSLFCSFVYNHKLIGIVNLHLPWDSVLRREKQIKDIIATINEEKLDYVLMAGDFNCSDTSDVHRFLTGDCSLGNMEANPNWYDLALSYAGVTGTKAEYTLNFRENPRFKGNTIETNTRVDRILLRNTYPHEFPTLKECTVYGERIYEDIGLSASDHYGVVAEIDWT